MNGPLWKGQMMSLTIVNDSGGAGGVESLFTIKGLVSVAPGVGSRQTIVARGDVVGGVGVWVLVSNTNWT